MNKQEFAQFVETLSDDVTISVDKLDEYFDAAATEFILGGDPLKLKGQRVKYAIIRVERRTEVDESFL